MKPSHLCIGLFRIRSSPYALQHQVDYGRGQEQDQTAGEERMIGRTLAIRGYNQGNMGGKSADRVENGTGHLGCISSDHQGNESVPDSAAKTKDSRCR